MRHLINLVESSQGFRLDPALDPQNYQITDSLRGVGRWKAKVLAANSASDGVNIGDWDDVGYTMISLTDDTIVPIARSDEHHMGFDLMDDLGIMGDFLPIFYGGSNYIYNQADVPKYQTALKKWLAWGGPDAYLSGTNDLTGNLMLFSDFVAHDGFIEIEPGTLSPIAQRFVEVLRDVAGAINVARNNPGQRSVMGAAFVAALRVPQYLSGLGYNFMGGYTTDDLKVLVENIKQAKAEGNLRKLEELIFGFNGIKNRIHNELRKNIQKAKDGQPDYFFQRDSKSLWGDPEMAVDMLGRF